MTEAQSKPRKRARSGGIVEEGERTDWSSVGGAGAANLYPSEVPGARAEGGSQAQGEGESEGCCARPERR